MSGPAINTKLKLDGEKEYKAALAEINSGLNVLKSELKLASAQFSDNAKSVEALNTKNDILERSILTQQEKIETLKDALQMSAQEYGESSEKTNKWKIALNNAEAELSKMQGELDANTDALKKMTSPMDKVKKALSDTKAQGGGVRDVFANLKDQFSLSTDSAKGLGTALTDISGKFGVELPDSAQKVISSLNGVNAKAALAATGIGLIAAAAIKAEKALISVTKETAEYAKELKTFSSVTGQSTETLQEFDYAAEMIGVSSDRIRDSLKETTNKMQEARDGNEETALAYMNLGVSITEVDGSLRSAEAVFYDTIDALSKVQNQTERDAIAMDLLSESAQELNPLIEIGSAGLKAYAQEAHEMGYILDNEAVASLAAVDDAQNKLLKTQESVTKQISAEYAPYMEEALSDTADFVLKIGNAFTQSGIVEDFGSILTSSSELLAPLGDLVSLILPALADGLHPVAELMAAIADTANLIVGLLTLNGDKIKTALGLNISSGQMSNMQKLYYKNAMSTNTYEAGKGYTGGGGYIEAGTGKWIPYNASGTDYFYGGQTLLGENGPERVILPQGARITSASETRYSGGGDIYIDRIVIDAKNVKEFNDIVRIAKNERISARMEVK